MGRCVGWLVQTCMLDIAEGPWTYQVNWRCNSLVKGEPVELMRACEVPGARARYRHPPWDSWSKDQVGYAWAYGMAEEPVRYEHNRKAKKSWEAGGVASGLESRWQPPWQLPRALGGLPPGP